MTDWRNLPEATLTLHHDKLGADINLRPLRSDDGGCMEEFYAALRDRDAFYFYPHPLDAEHAHLLASHADGPDRITLLVTEEPDAQERVMGYAYIQRRQEPDPWVFGICVRPDRQSLGLGTLLLGQLMHVARGAGVKRIELTVHTDNERALRLYTAYGFKKTEEFIYQRQGVPQYRMLAVLE